MKDVYGNPMKEVTASHKLKEKIASPASLAAGMTLPKAIALGAGLSAGTALGGYALSGALNRLDALRRDASRQTNMKKTMRVLQSVSPELRDSPRDMQRARAFYNIVHRTSPYVAREPVVAASVISTMLASPVGDLPTPDAFKQLAELQGKLDTRAVRPMDVKLNPGAMLPSGGGE